MAIINSEPIVEEILKNVDDGSLAILRNYEDPSAVSYVRQIIKLARKTKIKVIEEDYSSRWLPKSIVRIIDNYNNSEVSGILLVSPQPQHYKCLDSIDPAKRVEGTDFDDDLNRISCTAQACVYIAESCITLEGKNALVIGYGKSVGKPLAYLLMRKHCLSVTTTHAYTPMKDIFEKHIPNADIVFSAIGQKHLIRGNYCNKVFIDAGISISEGRVWGDIDPVLAEKNDITPVPGGVGPVTTALVLRNVSLAKSKQS